MSNKTDELDETLNGTLVAIDQIRDLIAQYNGDLDKVFYTNGKTGHKATGSFARLAKATGMTRSFIGKILKGQAAPSIDTIDKIAGVCNLPPAEIFNFIAKRQKAA